jgi:3-oxoacyl-[acyl-carrier protein] reductase
VRRLAADLAVPCAVVGADLRAEAEVDAMFAASIQVLGRIDVVVVNAAIWNPAVSPLHAMALAQWQDTLEADLTSAFLTCRAFLRHLCETPREAAALVLVGSTAALFGEANHADYAAAKAAMVFGLTRSLKNEIVRLAPRGRVNAVCPGWTDTPMAGDFTTDRAAMARATATMPLAKIAQPEDVAAAIVFLASHRLAGHVSGAVLPVAGGMEGRMLREGEGG